MPLTYQLNQLESNGLVNLAQSMPEVEYLFRHALVQDAAYQSLLHSSRQELHQAVGSRLEEMYPDRLEELAPILAHHFLEAGLEARAAQYLVQAGQAALDRFAHQEAVDYFSKASALTGQQGGEGGYSQCLLGLGQAYQAQGKNELALQHLKEALALPADPHQQADILDRMGTIYGTHLHDVEQARASFRRAMELLGEEDRSVEMARLCIHKGHLLFFAEPGTEQSKVYMHRARRLLEGTPHKAELAECYSQLGWLLAETEPMEAIHYGRLSLAVSPRVDSSSILAHQSLSNAYAQLKDWEQARYYASVSCDMARKLGQVVSEGYAQANLMVVCIRLHQYPEAFLAGKQALKIWQQVGNRGPAGDVISGLIVASYLAGESEAAERYEEEARILVENQPRFSYNLACWWSISGYPDRALRILLEVYPSLNERMRQLMLTDSDLEAVRELPEFGQLFENG